MISNESLLEAVIQRREQARPGGSTSAMLILTAVLFMAVGGSQWGWAAIVHLTVAIGLHELGHVIAMRILGYNNVRVLFIPMLGALAAGEPRELDAARNAWVALAGPLFGLLTAIAAALLGLLTKYPWLVQFAWVSFAINAFNLLPFVPLDGGRVTNEALFARFPKFEVAFRIIAIAALGYLAWSMQSWVFAILPFLMVYTLPQSFLRAEKIADLRREPGLRKDVLDLDGVIALRRAAQDLNAQLSNPAMEQLLVEHVHGLWLGVRKKFPGPAMTAGLLTAYLATALLLAPFTAGLVVAIDHGVNGR